MTMWVREDVEKNDWSEHAYTLKGDKFSGIGYYLSNVSVVGITATGEIVLMKNYYNSNPFYVFYFHPEMNTVKRLEVQGFEEFGRVYAFVDHVQDLTCQDKIPSSSRLNAPF
ncbi:hypothetical protein DY000_02060337 [Brassica cretica]|uniref:F-box associated beta-propeller type 3 domain-containing protein n=1 Tax=Brassica cretica TaxID=69181 RepID=A0ABQ7ARM6_BRACR|nr:hypothetical protein DY000_02060337 [Brassica cretica]